MKIDAKRARKLTEQSRKEDLYRAIFEATKAGQDSITLKLFEIPEYKKVQEMLKEDGYMLTEFNFAGTSDKALRISW